MTPARHPFGPFVLLVAAACVPVATARGADKTTFADHALPILRQRCGSCHNPDKKTAGLDVTTYAGIMQGGGSGEVIVPGNASGSHLFRVVNHDDEPKMPPDAPPIPEAERLVLRAWIDGGVLENNGSVAVVAPKKVDVAMAAPATQRPAVPPLPARLPLEPVLRTPVPDACASLATSPWAPLAAVCGQRQILLYRTDSLELAGVLPFPEGRPHVVRFSGGGGLVLAGGGVGAASGRVVVWNVKSGRRLQVLGDELDVVLAADVSPDQRLAVLGGPQKVARLVSLETGQKLHDLTKHTDWIQAAAFSPDGVLVATADRAGGVFVWESATGRDFLTIQAHPASVTSLAWRGDSNMLATACEDGQIRLWELENGTLVKAWPAHAGGVTAIDFTRDGRLVSVGRDKVPKLWKTDGAQERAFEATADVGLAVAFCDETSRLLAGDWTGEIRIWNAADAALIGQFDPNPPLLADRATAAEKVLGETRAALEQAVKVAADATARLDTLGKERTAALMAKQAADSRLAECQKQAESLAAAAAAAMPPQAAAIAALANLDQQIAAATAEVKAAADAVAAAQADPAKKSAAEQSLAAAQAKQADLQTKHGPTKADADAKAAAAATADAQAKAAAGARDQAKAAADTAAANVPEIEAAVAATAAQQPTLAAAIVDLKNKVAAAAGAQARWLGEVAFQANHDRLFATLGEKRTTLAQAEADLAAAEARRQADEQARLAAIAQRDGLQKQIESLTAAIATGERETNELLARIERRTGEVMAAQTVLEPLLQGIAAIDESAKTLQKGLAATPGDAVLQQAAAAIAAAATAKQGQIKQQQDTIAALAAEKAAWEKAVTEKRAAGDKHKADIAAATAGMAPAAAAIESATKAGAESARVSEEKRGVVAARQGDVDTALRELDALQGIPPTPAR